EKSVWKAGFFNMCFLGFVSIFFFILSEWVMRFFTQDPEVISNGANCLKIVAFGYLFYGYGMVVLQSFNGAGDTRTPVVLNIFTYWFFQIPLAWVLATMTSLQVSGAFWAIAIAESAIAVAAIVIFRKGKWKEVKV
ncbi:MAG: MATE family efflux transporter, partial [Bacteroidetes bacterium]|nr:MATE family efflux transporter [Bacteroidota bacterium]